MRENPQTPVYKCPRCLLQFIEPPFKDVREYYKTTYRQEHDCVVGKRLTPDERFKLVSPSMSGAADNIAKLVPQGASILEIGCSSGYLLAHLQKMGYDTYGCEWNPEDAQYVREVGGLPCEEGNLEEIYPGKSFTAVVATAVLEHQPNPVDFLKQMRKRLIGGGYIYLEVPNSQEALATIYQVPEFLNRYYRECHITYWTMETLTALMGALGFEATISIRQRYGLLDHINWVFNHGPMTDYKQATDYLNLVAEGHPMHTIMFRHTAKLDREYRLVMETFKAADTITCRGRLKYI